MHKKETMRNYIKYIYLYDKNYIFGKKMCAAELPLGECEWHSKKKGMKTRKLCERCYIH